MSQSSLLDAPNPAMDTTALASGLRFDPRAHPQATTNGIHTSDIAADTCITYGQSSRPSEPLPDKQIILHLGGPIQHNHAIHERLQTQFHVVRPCASDLQRPSFIHHLKNGTWGNFSAIMRPFWRSGNDMQPWDEELIDLLPGNMKVMAGAGAGFDWVDTKHLAARGIIYCNGAGASTESVADMALFHIISVFRHMMWSIQAARSHCPEQWQEAHHAVPAISHNPHGHRLGIIGLGLIGYAIAQKVRAALGMEIIYHDVIRKPDLEPSINATFIPQLNELLPQCDCVLLATPHGTPLLTAQTIALLPRGARIVNIARGSLIDESALIDALDSGHISAAALDVHADEPNVNQRLCSMRNVTLTSHTGGGSVETNQEFERLAMENVEAVLRGQKALTPVNMHFMEVKEVMQTMGSDKAEERIGNDVSFASMGSEQTTATNI